MNKYGVLNYIFYFFVIFFITTEIVLQVVLPHDKVYYAEEVELYDAQWTWIQSDGSRQIVDVPGTYDVPKKQPLILESIITEELDDSNYIYFRSSQQSVKVFVDNVLRYDYYSDFSAGRMRNSASYYVVVPLYSDDAGKTLRLELTTDSQFSGLINPIYIGEEINIWYKIVSENIVEIFVAIFMASIAVISIIAGIILKAKYQRGRMLEYLGWIVLVSVGIMFSESQIRQLLVPNVTALADMTYYLVPLLLFVIIMFVNSIQKYNYTKIYLFFQIGLLIEGIVIFFLQWNGVMEYYNSLSITFGIAVIIFFVFLLTVYKDIKLKRFAPYKEVIISIFILVGICILGHFLVNILDVMDSIGVFIATGLVCLFITSIRMTARNIKDLSNEKQQALYENKAKEQFFAAISHEIRTPLNGVLGMNEMIIRENNDSRIDKYAQSIKSSGNILLSLINDILDYSKMESGKLNVFNSKYSTVKMLSTDYDTFKKQADSKGLVLEYNLLHEIPSFLEGDEVRMRQIKTNLLSNAIKYTENGKIKFDVDCRTTNDVCRLIISVKDTGKGIDKDDVPHLFESFKRIEDEQNHHIEGTGLGLAITKQLVDIMQGEITVKSEVGKGSEFTVSIPQKIIDATPIKYIDWENAENSVNSDNNSEKDDFVLCPDATVLVVDDNEMNRMVISLLLEQSKCKVEMACNGEEAYKMCKDKHYDMILMDHLMPVMDGIEAIHLIRNDKLCPNEDTRVIALTANAYTGIKEMYVGEGFDDYLAKPVEPDKLTEMLKRYINTQK